jgi:hypothetical protein
MHMLFEMFGYNLHNLYFAFDFLFAYSDFHYFDCTLFLGRHCCEVRGVTWHCVGNYLEVSFITFLPEILRTCSYEG